MRKQYYVLLLILLLIVIPVWSQPPFQESTGELSLQIELPQFDLIPLNTNYSIYFHVYNRSNGIFINTSICVVHLYDGRTGEHIITYSNITAQKYDFEIYINDTIFPSPGTYYNLVQCELENSGGFYGYDILVGDNEYLPTVPDSIILSVVLILFMLLFVVSLTFAFLTDGSNKFTIGDTGEPLVEINSGKYLKLLLYLLSYLFFWILTWAGWQIAEKFLLSETLNIILRVIFIVETILWVPMLIMIVSIGLVKLFADIDLEKTTRRGLFPRK